MQGKYTDQNNQDLKKQGYLFYFWHELVLKNYYMKRILSFLFIAASVVAIGQPAAYKPTSPQVVYEMYVECVEPIHKAYDRMSLSTNKPSMTASKLNTMLKEKMAKLETFHKEKLHRDSYTAAKNYLMGIRDVNAELMPVLEKIEAADPNADISAWLEELHDITIHEKPLADDYRMAIRKVIDMFKEEWDTWLEAEVIYFARLTAQERNRLFETGFGKDGLHAVERRFYTAEYFVVNMEQDVTDSRVNTIKATFHDLSELPDYMVNSTDEFIEHVDKVMTDYRYAKTKEDNKIIYSKGAGTNLMFVVKKVEIKVISESSKTLTIKFYY